MPTPNVALLTDHRYTALAAAEGDWYLRNILDDDRLLQEAPTRRGLTLVRVDWADPEVDRSRFRCAVFRTTRNDFERSAEFSAWLGRAERATWLCNSGSTVRSNVDKHHLADLADRGVPVVPSRFLERGSTRILADVLATECGNPDRDGLRKRIAEAQLAVGDMEKYLKFAGNVKAVDSRDKWREADVSIKNKGHHDNRNAGTYPEVGLRLGCVMAELLEQTK
jgi:hypothetical protein